MSKETNTNVENENVEEKKATGPLHKHYIAAFWVTLVVAIGLIVGGFFVPPMGEIDGSVLTAVGEILVWPALGFAGKALEDGKTINFSKGNTTIEVRKNKQEELLGTGDSDDFEA